MIDLHLHVLPAVDDGPGSLRESRAMLERLARLGFSHLVATPHLMEPLSSEYRFATKRALELVQPIAAEFGLSVDKGYEHLLSPDLARRLDAGETSTLAGSNAVMVELPFIGWPNHTESALFDLRIAGFRPVLAHPERYLEVQSNPERALAAAQQGVVLQLTYASFAGLYGRVAERTAKSILESGLRQGAHILFATDAHSDGSRLSSVPDGISRIRRNFPNGGAIVEWASTVVPTCLLANDPVPAFHDWFETDAGRQTVDSGALQKEHRRARHVLRPFGRSLRSRTG